MNAHGRAVFLAERQKGLGGTDISAVLGMNPWRSQVDVFLEKTGRVAPMESALRLRFGTFGEEFVAKEYEIATGSKVVRYTQPLTHPDYPFARGNLDRLLIPEGQKIAAHQGKIRARKGLECKTVGGYALASGEWGEPGTDQVPVHYLLQTAWYMALAPMLEEMDLAALVGAGEELRIYTIKADADLQDELLRRGNEWWVRHILADVAPEPQSEADVRALFPRDNQQETEASDETASTVAALLELKASMKAMEKREQELKDALLPAIGEAAVLRFNGRTLATYKAARDGSKTDWQAVAKELKAPAETIAAHTVTTVGSRRLLLKEPK